MRRLVATALLAMIALSACSGAAPPVDPTAVPTRAPLPTATPPAPTPTPVPEPPADPLAQIVARQADLHAYRQAMTLELTGVDRAGRALSMELQAEGETVGPNSRLQIQTGTFGAPAGFQVIRVDGHLYVNPLGFWVVADDPSAIPLAPLLPVPVASNPSEMISLVAGGRFVPSVGVPVRGVLTDVLAFELPPERANELTAHLMVPQTVERLFGVPTYTALSGEIAVGQSDGFARRVRLQVGGHADGDPGRAFSIRANTELWDINDPSILVNAPTEPVVALPSLAR